MACEAGKFYPPDKGIKLHGCIEVPCEGCGVSMCLHWKAIGCPRCANLQRNRYKPAIEKFVAWFDGGVVRSDAIPEAVEMFKQVLES